MNDEGATDPFARGSADPRGSGESAAAPTATGPKPDGQTGPTESEPTSLADLVSGKVPDCPWQFNPYDRKSSTWLAAAQRRHQHRRRSNVLLGVAAVDLSGPHEPTPMVGQRLGHKPGHYFVVLAIEVDQAGHRSTETQTDLGATDESQPLGRDASAAPEASASTADAAAVDAADQSLPAGRDGPEPFGSDDGDASLPRLPLVYCEVVNQKADAAAATERMLAQVRDEHGHLPSHAVFRLHSDRGQEFCPHSLERYCESHGIRRTTTAGYDPLLQWSGRTSRRLHQAQSAPAPHRISTSIVLVGPGSSCCGPLYEVCSRPLPVT